MAKSYDASLGTNRDWVRFLIGDNVATMALADEEIDAIIADETSAGDALKFFAAASAVEAMYALHKAGRKGVVDRQISKLRLRFGEDVSAANAVAKAAADFRVKGAFRQSKAVPKAYSLRML